MPSSYIRSLRTYSHNWTIAKFARLSSSLFIAECERFISKTSIFWSYVWKSLTVAYIAWVNFHSFTVTCSAKVFQNSITECCLYRDPLQRLHSTDKPQAWDRLGQVLAENVIVGANNDIICTCTTMTGVLDLFRIYNKESGTRFN